jgi:hypothetical protein
MGQTVSKSAAPMPPGQRQAVSLDDLIVAVNPDLWLAGCLAAAMLSWVVR